MKRGAAWELQLGIWNEQYRRAGKAFLFRCHPGVNQINGRLTYASKGPPDFVGCLAGGRTIVFDAKEVSGPRFSFNNLKPHQADAFDNVVKLGGLAFLAIQWMDGHQIIGRTWVDWQNLEWRYRAWQHEKGAHASITRLSDGVPMSDDGWLPLLG